MELPHSRWRLCYKLMPILIDGYNLLHVAGILARNVGPGGLERARLALLNFLAESLEPEEAAKTTVVFDAHQPPWGAPRRLTHRGVVVIFAAGHEDADSLIEELIEQDHAPRQLTVVSSDHRVQRAARHRKAHVAASDTWYAKVIAERRRRLLQDRETAERPAVPLLAEDVEYWIRQFGGESELTRFVAEELEKVEGRGTASAGPSSEQSGENQPEVALPRAPAAKTSPQRRKRSAESDDRKPCDPYNPFPPGYGEDLQV